MNQSRNNKITRVSIVGIGANAVMAFDIVVSFDHDAPAICHSLVEQISQKYPGRKVHITTDTNFSG